MENLVNNFVTHLTAGVDASQTAIPVQVNTPVAADFRVLVGAELMKVTNNATLTWIVERGAEGTTPSAHPAGTSVIAVLTADGLNAWLTTNPSGGAPSGPAGGVLAGTFPNPTFAPSPAFVTPDVGVATGESLNLFGNTGTNGYIQFNSNLPPAPPVNRGRLYGRAFAGQLNIGIYPHWQSETSSDLNLMREQLQNIQNTSGGTFTKGQLIYASGSALSGAAVGSLAKADVIGTSSVFGVVFQSTILNNDFGLILTAGTLFGVNTLGFTLGDILYLSETVAGAFRVGPPPAPAIAVRIGVVTDVSATAGSIVLDIQPALDPSLDSLSDVSIAAPVLDQFLRFNGTNWVNATFGSVSASAGVGFFLDETLIIPPGAGPQSFPLRTLLRTPSVAGQTSHSVAVSTGTVATTMLAAYRNATMLGGATIEGGIWDFGIYCSVSSATNTNEIIANVYRSIVGIGTVTITGVGTTRTATVTGDTPFVAGDASADVTLASYLTTPNGLFQISAFTSSSVVSVICLATYTNEVGAAYRMSRRLFGVTTGDIQETAVTLHSVLSTQPAFVIAATDFLSIFFFGRTNAGVSRTINLFVGGTVNASNVLTPLATRHNQLAGLQGGAGDEFYHLTLAEYTGSGTGVFARVNSPVFITPNIGVATGSVSGNAGTASVAPAGTLSGAALAAGVLASSLTSVGVLTSLGIGAAPAAFVMQNIGGTLRTGSAASYALQVGGTIPATSTAEYISYRSGGITAASAFTLADARHYHAANITLGAGSAITVQYGFVTGDLSSAITNYGFVGTVSAGTNKWNVYMSGTAQNAFAGNVRIGSVAAPTVALDVTGAVNISGAITASSIGTSGATNLSFLTNGTTRWYIQNTTGHFHANVDNVSDIGAVGANRPRTIYVGTSLRMEGTGASYFGGAVGIGATSPNAAAALQIDSTTQGFLLPRMTTTQKNAISTPPAGLQVYDSTVGKASLRTATAWETVTSV